MDAKASVLHSNMKFSVVDQRQVEAGVQPPPVLPRLQDATAAVTAALVAAAVGAALSSSDTNCTLYRFMVPLLVIITDAQHFTLEDAGDMIIGSLRTYGLHHLWKEMSTQLVQPGPPQAPT